MKTFSQQDLEQNRLVNPLPTWLTVLLIILIILIIAGIGWLA